jgi:hypothetical protein
MGEVFVGIDISKDALDVAAWPGTANGVARSGEPGPPLSRALAVRPSHATR